MTLIALRVAPCAHGTTGWWKPSGRLLFPLSVVAAIIFAASGTPVDPELISVALCGSALALGLPHGALDLAHLRRAPVGFGPAIALYLAVAGMVYALWRFDAVVALAAFLALAVRHFAEDWQGTLPEPFATGTSLAVLTAPALFHHETLAALFALVAGAPAAAGLADAALLLAPVTVVLASCGIALLWQHGEREHAVETVTALVAMIALPPLLGFALFFALMHSPRHFAQGSVALRGVDSFNILVTIGFAGGVALAAAIYGAGSFPTASAGVISTVFVTLSVLTLPHMTIPALLCRGSRS